MHTNLHGWAILKDIERESALRRAELLGPLRIAAREAAPLQPTHHRPRLARPVLPVLRMIGLLTPQRR